AQFRWPRITENGIELGAGDAVADSTLATIFASFGAGFAFLSIVVNTSLDIYAKLNYEAPVEPIASAVVTLISFAQQAGSLLCAWPFFYAVPGKPTDLE